MVASTSGNITQLRNNTLFVMITDRARSSLSRHTGNNQVICGRAPSLLEDGPPRALALAGDFEDDSQADEVKKRLFQTQTSFLGLGLVGVVWTKNYQLKISWNRLCLCDSPWHSRSKKNLSSKKFFDFVFTGLLLFRGIFSLAGKNLTTSHEVKKNLCSFSEFSEFIKNPVEVF